MLKQKDTNQLLKQTKYMKNPKSKNILAPRFKTLIKEKENIKPSSSNLGTQDAPNLQKLVFKNNQKVLKLKSKQTSFGIRDIKNVFIDKSDIFYQKKKTVTNLEDSNQKLKNKKIVCRSQKNKIIKPKKKNLKFCKNKSVFLKFKLNERETKSFRLFNNREMFTPSSQTFLRKRISQEFDQDCQTDEDSIQNEIEIETNLLIKSIKRHKI